MNNSLATLLLVIVACYVIYRHNQIIRGDCLTCEYAHFISGNKTMDPQSRAMMLAIIHNYELLLEHLMVKSKNGDPFARLYHDKLYNKFNIRQLFENNTKVGGNGNTSYTVNKGDKMVMCLRDVGKDNQIHSINTLMFVFLHELGHVVDSGKNHGASFWGTFRRVLDYSVEANIYVPVDYSVNPIKYCNMDIKSNPLFTGNYKGNPLQ